MKFIGLIGILLPFQVFCQVTEEKFEFSIFFGKCFSNDTVNFKINGMTILVDQKLLSNPVGYAGCNIIQFEKKLVAHCKDTTQNFSVVPAYLSLQVGIAINKLWSYHSFDITKGKYILIENCGRSEPNDKYLTLRQMSEPPKFLTPQ